MTGEKGFECKEMLFAVIVGENQISCAQRAAALGTTIGPDPTFMSPDAK